MQLSISMWRSRYEPGRIYWQVPGLEVRHSSDIGTAAREALELVETNYPNIDIVNFTLA